MDRRCVYYRKPLLESGTLGTKGNVQVRNSKIRTENIGFSLKMIGECSFPLPPLPAHFRSATSRGGQTVCVLDSGSSGPGSSLAWSLGCVLGQDPLLSKCLSSPRCINGYRHPIQEGEGGGGSINTPSYSNQG